MIAFHRTTLALCIAASFNAGAQHFPVKPVRMLVGFAPGGGTDVVARILAPRLTEIWNQQVVIDNRAGATGTIAAGVVARLGPADGLGTSLGAGTQRAGTHRARESQPRTAHDAVVGLRQPVAYRRH